MSVKTIFFFIELRKKWNNWSILKSNIFKKTQVFEKIKKNRIFGKLKIALTLKNLNNLSIGIKKHSLKK